MHVQEPVQFPSQMVRPPACAAGKLVRKYRLLQKVTASFPTYFCLLAAHYVTDITPLSIQKFKLTKL